MIQILPYELVERLFGPFVAEYFNEIVVCVMIVAWIGCYILRSEGWQDWISNAQERQQKKYEYSDPQWSYNKKTRMWVDSDQMDEKERRKASEKVRENWKTYQSQTGQWSPTGWYYNASTGKWEPPEHPTDIEWVWDAKKQIWVDAGKERRMERYREYHKDKPPTFEEWKAQREQELKNQQKQNNTPEE